MVGDKFHLRDLQTSCLALVFSCLVSWMPYAQADPRLLADLSDPRGREPARAAETSVAFCLGVAEATMTAMVEMILQSAAKYPSFNTLPIKKHAAANILAINRLSEYLKNQGVLLGQRDPIDVLAARQDGLKMTQACFEEQFRCQAECQKNSDSEVEQTCAEKCASAGVCQRTGSCVDIEKDLVP